MKQNDVKSISALFITSFIWGLAFIFQSVAMDHIQPFTFTAVRSLLGSATLLPIILISARKKSPETKKSRKALYLSGALCGICLFLANNLQQIGILYTTVGKAGFITSCYILFVAIFGIFLKRAVSPFIWVSVALTMAGLYLLCINENLSVNFGDLLTLGCAFTFTFHILLIDHFAPIVDCIKLSSIQFLVSGALSAICALFFENPTPAAIFTAWQPILYTGVLSCGVAYTLQVFGQRRTNPLVASLILSLEACFSAVGGWIILGERLNTREIIGCSVMFIAIILAQLPIRTVAAPEPTTENPEILAEEIV